MRARKEIEFRSLDLRGKHVTGAWMAASISAGLTLILGVLALAGVEAVPGFDAWILFDAAILAGLAFGVAKRSRLCAVILVLYGVFNEVYMALSGQRASILRLIFIYFYIRGAIQIFQDHHRNHAMRNSNNT
jgi:hypothetical protein